MVVTCFCAAWCHVCNDYREGFFALSGRFPGATFRWLDIEDDAQAVGEREVENFPTVLIERDGEELFYGTLLPKHEHLARLLESMRERSSQ